MTAHRPIVVTYKDGREYGVKDAATAKRVHPDATVTRYQDGSPLEDVAKAKPKDDASAKDAKA